MKVFDLQRFLKDYNYTQQELANLLSCSQSHLSTIHTGKKFFSKKKIELLEYHIKGSVSSYITDREEIISVKKKKQEISDVKMISSEAWDVIKNQAESLASKDRQMEELISLLKKANAQEEGNAICAIASGSDLVK